MQQIGCSPELFPDTPLDFHPSTRYGSEADILPAFPRDKCDRGHVLPRTKFVPPRLTFTPVALFEELPRPDPPRSS